MLLSFAEVDCGGKGSNFGRVQSEELMTVEAGVCSGLRDDKNGALCCLDIQKFGLWIELIMNELIMVGIFGLRKCL